MDVVIRSLTLEDILALKHLDGIWATAVDLNPAGDQLAVVLNQGLGERHVATVPFLMGMDHGQLQLIDLVNDVAVHVLAPEGKGFASPLYSPDGQRVAVVTACSAGVGVAVVEVASRAVNFYDARQLAVDPQRKWPFQWLDNHTLVCQLLPAGERSENLDATFQVRDTAPAAWARALGNRQSTASPLHITAVTQSSAETVVIEVREEVLVLVAPRPADKTAIQAFEDRPSARWTNESAMAAHFASERLLWQGRGIQVHSWRSNQGSELRITADDQQTRCVLKFNTHLNNVRTGEVMDLGYTLSDGRAQSLRCILPPDHQPGTRRPGVMFVYPRRQRTLARDAHRWVEGPGLVYNAHLFAAQGYVVMEPNLPFDANQEGEYIDVLANAVAPALEAADLAGLIDRGRVHVFGQSAGGWAVMALLATTDFFRSGISMAGISDVAAYDTQPDVRYRYQPTQDSAFHGAGIGARLLGIEQAPWQAPQRYIHNSPLYRVQSINAPLLLMHGDLDYVHMSQSEAMFMAMKAEGKTAQFIRYWGEDHMYCSAANIRDAFERIIDWLEGHASLAEDAFITAG